MTGNGSFTHSLGLLQSDLNQPMGTVLTKYVWCNLLDIKVCISTASDNTQQALCT